MFHKATDMRFLEGTAMEVVFQDGKVKRYDMASLFGKYPQLRALEDRELFLSGKLMGAYGIMWNDDLDIETETIYEDGVTVREEQPVANQAAACRKSNWQLQPELTSLTFPRLNVVSQIHLCPRWRESPKLWVVN